MLIQEKNKYNLFYILGLKTYQSTWYARFKSQYVSTKRKLN